MRTSRLIYGARWGIVRRMEFATPEKPDNAPRVAIIGAGAAGVFAAIACKRANPRARVTIYERNDRGLRKVLASGGGRCNLTHACFEPEELVKYYPRGARELVGPFYAFGPKEVMDWFETEGLSLKTETDGRVFPASDRSGSVARALEEAARACGVKTVMHAGLGELAPHAGGGFKLWFNKGAFTAVADAVLLATGGLRDAIDMRRIVEGLGHTVEKPIPSLFTFKCDDKRLQGLAGLSVPQARLCVEGEKNAQTGALLLTHRGFSGPAALRVSAWNAPLLFAKQYQFRLKVAWMADLDESGMHRALDNARRQMPKRHIGGTSPFEAIPQRLWERLVAAAGIGEEIRWNTLSREKEQALARELCVGLYDIGGRAQNKDEFVTCGGVRLKEVHFKNMQSRLVSNLYFAGELLDIDAVTGGFNLQAAWTTGLLAGEAMAAVVKNPQLPDESL